MDSQRIHAEEIAKTQRYFRFLPNDFRRWRWITQIRGKCHAQRRVRAAARNRQALIVKQTEQTSNECIASGLQIRRDCQPVMGDDDFIRLPDAGAVHAAVWEVM